MGRRNTTKRENRRGMIIISIVLLVLCATLSARYHYLEKQYQLNAETIATLEDNKKMEEERTERLQQQELYQQTDSFIEETARRLLNLIRPGDTTIKPNVEE